MDKETLHKVQSIQLEMAREIKRVCREHDIPYFLYRGTFLGAVRHQGVIPWDDDMDFGMLRPDYEKFCRIAPQALSEQYCFQNWHTEKNYALPFGKVRRRGTLFVEAKSRQLPENGVYIDIYPLDYAPADPVQRKKLAKQLLHLFRIRLMHCGYTPWMEDTRILWKKRIGYLAYQAAGLLISRKKLVQTYEKLVMAVPEGDTVYEQSALPIAYYFEKNWVQELAEYPYGDTSFSGPCNYDAFLRCLYGEYMTLPPEDKRENRHQIQILDLGN